MKKIKKFIKMYGETVIWLTALVALFFMNPDGNHHSLCVAKAVGFKYCIGCGLGHSIHYALHLNFIKSFEAHFFGIPATCILIYQIFKSIYKTYKPQYYGPAANTYDVS